MQWYHWAGIAWVVAIAVAVLVCWGSGDTLKRQPLDKVKRFD